MEGSLSFKLLKSAKPSTDSNPKAKIYLNIYHFATRDNQTKIYLETEFMVDPGSTRRITNYPTHKKFNEIGRKMSINKSKNEAKSYNGPKIRMLGHTSF